MSRVKLRGREWKSGSQREQKLPPTGLVALALFFTSFALYFLTYRGLFDNAADAWLTYASAENLATHGVFHVNQLYWIGSGLHLARFGVDGNLYSEHSTALTLLTVPLYWLSLALPWLGGIQMALLLNLFVTAATNAVFFLLLRRLDYSLRLSLLVTALYIVTTPAWVYTKTYSGEPVTALGLVAGLLFLLSDAPILAGVALAVTLLNKLVNSLAVPVYILFLLALYEPGMPWHIRPLLGKVGRFLLPVVLCGAALLLYNAVRYGGPLQTIYAEDSFGTPLDKGLYGLLFSPGRGLFVYVPVLALGLVGLPLLYRRSRALTGLIVVLLLANALLFARWHAWYGSLANWGPRYLIPFIPLLLAPVTSLFRRIAQLQSTGRRWAAIGACLPFVLAGALINIPPAIWDYGVYTSRASAYFHITAANEEQQVFTFYFDPNLSPVWRQWNYLSPGSVNLAWWRQPVSISGDIGIALLPLLACLLLLVVNCVVFILIWRGWRVSFPVLALVGGGLLSATILFSLAGYQHDPGLNGDLAETWRHMAGLSRPGDLVLTVDPFQASVPFNYDKSRMVRYGFARWPGSEIPPQAERLLQKGVMSHSRIWVVRQDQQQSGIEVWLLAHRAQASETHTYGQAQAILYAVPSPA